MRKSRTVKAFMYILLIAISISLGYSAVPKNGIKKIHKYKIAISMDREETNALKNHIIDLRRFLNNRDEEFNSNIRTEILSENIGESKNWSKLKNNKFTNDVISDICSIIMTELAHREEVKSMVMLEFKYRNIDVKFPIKID